MGCLATESMNHSDAIETAAVELAKKKDCRRITQSEKRKTSTIRNSATRRNTPKKTTAKKITKKAQLMLLVLSEQLFFLC